MIREVDLVSYLPPFLGEYKEIREALMAENPEFRLVWEAADRVQRNGFIATADEFGISRFESMLGILPSREDSLEVRRARVLLKFNTKNKYTIRMLREVIASVVGGGNYFTQLMPEEYGLTVQILNHNIRLLRSIYDTIAPMIPANMKLFYYGRYIEECGVSVRPSASVRFVTGFYPRFNLPRLCLDGSWKLDGTRKLSGYDSRETVDLYPVSLRLMTSARGSPDEKLWLHLQTGAGKEKGIESQESLSVRSDLACGISSGQGAAMQTGAAQALKERTGLRLRECAQEPIEEMAAMSMSSLAECKAAPAGKVGVRASAVHAAEAGAIRVHNESYLDGDWKLNGSRKLNGGVELR